VGNIPLADLPDQQVACLFSLMPQDPALLDVTIFDNLIFGWVDPEHAPRTPSEFSSREMAMIEDIGLGRLCRLKALDGRPTPAHTSLDLSHLRQCVRTESRQRLPSYDNKLAVNLQLSWRENLLGAVKREAHHVQDHRDDEPLLEILEQDPWRDAFMIEGMAHPVGRNAERLSGGQAQLVALGRALLRDAPSLILDEPTSSLDPAHCQAIARALKRYEPDHTIITVTHDQEFARKASQILVLEGGRLLK
jgi:ABC-type transport system involved in cytochrome bd biosynthesis fused ATPase/permease subunit